MKDQSSDPSHQELMVYHRELIAKINSNFQDSKQYC